ncbi:complement component C8 gamma chain isoform X4 [Diceros bicornis minor]|uniref:complement component C8 gamma chain isoform X4 n=1 Tax=Diceros bicornis minor TaxID=77932 RepID=UPI0026EA4050|nr:complement component C8 gamma chain isoform X4 [Diceros bicornis minor]
MLPPRTALLLTLLLAAASLGQRARRPPRPPSPISTIQPKANFDAQQFAGTWLLVAVASSCRFLQEQGHRAEATTLQVAPQGAAMAVGTFQKLPLPPREQLCPECVWAAGPGGQPDGGPHLVLPQVRFLRGRRPVPRPGRSEQVRPWPRGEGAEALAVGLLSLTEPPHPTPSLPSAPKAAPHPQERGGAAFIKCRRSRALTPSFPRWNRRGLCLPVISWARGAARPEKPKGGRSRTLPRGAGGKGSPQGLESPAPRFPWASVSLLQLGPCAVVPAALPRSLTEHTALLASLGCLGGPRT